jgi:Cu(I)-responsive transcriptional regulator
MNIGEAAKRSGVNPKTIRYYESIGLIPTVDRSTGNYRRYGDGEVETLRFIARARSLGFSVEDVGTLLALYRDRKRASAEVKRIAGQHIAEIDRKVEELRAMRKTLAHLMAKCHGDERPDCPILEDLAGKSGCH